ncbi:MAG: hypothetical protein GY786_24415 [Proteobacteria bacterium]|nr:hypothetical protein [Pseudomonadota bacterium]
MKKWNMIHKIKVYYNNGEGESMRCIAKKLEISKNTVKKYLRMNEEGISRYLKHSERYKLLDIHQDMIKDLLQKYPLMSGVKVRKKLGDLGHDVEVSNRTIRRYIKVLKEKYPTRQKRYYEPVSELLPGLQCQVDPGVLRNVLIY